MRRVSIQSGMLRYVVVASLLPLGAGCSAPNYETPSIDPHIRTLRPTDVGGEEARDGEEVIVSGKPLTLAQCVAIALDRNPLRRAAEEGVTAARAVVGSVNSAYYPRVDLNAGYSRWERHIFLPDGVGQPGMTSSVGPTDDW